MEKQHSKNQVFQVNKHTKRYYIFNSNLTLLTIEHSKQDEHTRWETVPCLTEAKFKKI